MDRNVYGGGASTIEINTLPFQVVSPIIYLDVCNSKCMSKDDSPTFYEGVTKEELNFLFKDGKRFF